MRNGAALVAAAFAALCTVVLVCVTPTTAAATASYDAGVSYLIQNYNFSSPQSQQSMQQLYGDVNVRWLSVVFSWYQPTINDTTIAPVPGRTPDDEDVRLGIEYAHSLGLKVLLKVHVDLSDDPTHWRGQIGTYFTPSQWDEWFASYTRFIDHYADRAAHWGVDKFAVGTELTVTSGHEQPWRNVVASVRNLYGGALVFAANWDTIDLGWWDALDFIGVDAYFPLTAVADPTPSQLAAAWSPRIAQLSALSAKNGNKPVMFTEIGYCSDAGANTAPYGCPDPIRLDMAEQSGDYAAVFANAATQPWFAGVYWWAWSTDVTAGGTSDAGYSPQNKPAAQVLAQNYGAALQRS